MAKTNKKRPPGLSTTATSRSSGPTIQAAHHQSDGESDLPESGLQARPPATAQPGPTTEVDLPNIRVRPVRPTLDLPDQPHWNVIEIELSRPVILRGIGVGDPVFEGRPLPNTTLIEPARQKWRGSQRKRCVMTQPQTKDGNSKSDKKVCLQRTLIRIALEQYEIGYMVGYRVAKSINPIGVECEAIRRNTKRLNDQIKRETLSQEPSFPRVKSKTGVTRIGRRRKGVG